MSLCLYICRYETVGRVINIQKNTREKNFLRIFVAAKIAIYNLIPQNMRKILLSMMVSATLLPVTALASGKVYYASPTGSGDGSSYAKPCSFQSGLNKISSGDTLYLLGGQYDLSTRIDVSNKKSGTAEKRTVIAGYPGEKAILDYRKQPYANEVTGSNNIGLCLKGGEYYHLKDFTIRYAGKNGLLNNASYCLIENLEVYGCGDSGIQHKEGGGNVIKNCDSHHNFDYKNGGIDSPNYGENSDGFADKQYTNENPNTYIGCRSWSNGDDGWDFFQRVGNTVMENCICYDNGPKTYDMYDHPRYEVDKAWFDQFSEMELASYPCHGNGNGFKLGGKNTEHNVTLVNCLAVANASKGFDQNNNAGAMKIYNATAYNNNQDYGFSNGSYGSLLIRNSVSYRSKTSNRLACKSVDAKYNTWNLNISCSDADFVGLNVADAIAPRQADGSLPETTLLHLAAGSKLIDAGIDCGYPYNGMAPDLGCYESAASSHVNNIVESFEEVRVVTTASEIVVLGTAEELSIQLYTLTGQLVAQMHGNNFSTTATPAGRYIVRVLDKQGQPLAVQHVVIY